MNLVIFLIAGALVGYIAGRTMRTNSQQDPLLDIIVGVVGAIVAGYMLSPQFGVRTINDAITIPVLLVSLVGAVVLLWIYNMITRRA